MIKHDVATQPQVALHLLAWQMYQLIARIDWSALRADQGYTLREPGVPNSQHTRSTTAVAAMVG